jgi:aryl-alcohol dehydrogenase-like predicted oxidoreductase
MRYREFGTTGIRVSEVGVGCGGLGGERKMGLEPALERALELGINFFDTCDTYAEGRSHQTLGRFFRRHPRDKYVVCTKFGGVIDAEGWHRDISVPHLHEAFAASCGQLGVDHLDIYLVHTPPRDIAGEEELFAALEKMKDEGKIRAYGLSLENNDFAAEIVGATGSRAIEITFSLLKQVPRAGFLEVAREQGVGIVAKSPLARGLVTDSFVADDPPADDPRLLKMGREKFEEHAALHRRLRPILTANGRTMAQGALAWLLSFPEVSTVIPGITSLERIEETAAVSDMRLTPEELVALDEVMGVSAAGGG